MNWFTLEATSTAIASVERRSNTNNIATTTSGASLASGATHWMRTNSEIPKARPVSTSESAKASATTRIAAAADANNRITDTRRCVFGSAMSAAAGPTPCASSPPERIAKNA